MKEIKINDTWYTLTPKAEEFTYPMFFRDTKHTSELVVRFDGLEVGEVVASGNSAYERGFKKEEPYWVPHTDTSVWTQVEDPDLIPDKHLAYCWDEDDAPVLKFYDAINKCIFYNEGSRRGSSWGHYLKADINALPEPLKSKMLDMQSKLED